MINFDRWKSWTAEYPTHDTFVEAGWVFMIGAALQRRVWMGGLSNPIYPNNYIIQVAPPGVGKSLVSDQVVKILSSFSLRGEDIPADDPSHYGGGNSARKLKIPIAADSTSYEAFVRETSQNVRVIKKPEGGLYMHMSMCFVLDEVTSIFHKDSEKLIGFLLSGWGCKESHRHSGITRGNDEVRNLCVNLMGGTQPDKFARINTVDLISSGFTRRAIIVYAPENRFNRVLIPPPTPEQETDYSFILAHIKKLTELYGPVTLSAAGMEWFKAWWEQRGGPPRINGADCLQYYYASKNLHLLKVAMALHFGERADSYEISLETLLAAKDLLEGWEKTANRAYGGGRDDYIITKRKVEKQLLAAAKPLTMTALYSPFVDEMTIADFRNILADLLAAGRIIPINGSSYQFNLKALQP